MKALFIIKELNLARTMFGNIKTNLFCILNYNIDKMNTLSGEQLCKLAEDAMQEYGNLYVIPDNCVDHCFTLIHELIKRNEPHFKAYSVMLTEMLSHKF